VTEINDRFQAETSILLKERYPKKIEMPQSTQKAWLKVGACQGKFTF
jgi:hypothetical protein